MPENQTDILIQCYERVKLFMKADELGVKVGKVLVALFFGIGGPIELFYIPAPFGIWFGGLTIVVGILFYLFIHRYGLKAQKKPPHALIGRVNKVVELSTRTGETAKWFQIQVTEAFELAPEGKGSPLSELNGTETKRLLVLKTHEAETEILATTGDMIFVCVPNGQIVSYAIDGILTEYRY